MLQIEKLTFCLRNNQDNLLIKLVEHAQIYIKIFNLISYFILRIQRKLALKIDFWLQLPLVRDQTELWKNQNKNKPQVAAQLPGGHFLNLKIPDDVSNGNITLCHAYKGLCTYDVRFFVAIFYLPTNPHPTLSYFWEPT